MVIAIAAQKGGTGKTTVAFNLGAELTHRRKKVLMVDMDSQASLSALLNVEDASPNVLDVLTQGTPIAKAIQPTKYGDLVPASLYLSGLDLAVANVKGREHLLRRALEPALGGYDYVIIDTPPALGSATVNAMTAADGIIIAAQADYLSLSGVRYLLQTVDDLRDVAKKGMAVLGILITRYSGRSIVRQTCADELAGIAKAHGTRLYAIRLREYIAVVEAQVTSQSLRDYAPRSNAARDFAAFTKEMLKKG